MSRTATWAVISGALFVVVAAVFAQLEPPPRPIWESSPLTLAYLPAAAARLSWNQRHRGPARVVATGLAAVALGAALVLAFHIAMTMLHPWAREQSWLAPTVTVAITLGTGAFLVVRTFVESTWRGRIVAAAQGALVLVTAAGFAVVARLDAFAPVGAALCLGGPIAIYLLERERRAIGRASPTHRSET